MSNISEIFKPYILNSGGYAGGRSAKDISAKTSKVYKLSSNENLMGTSSKVLKVLHDSLHELNIYPDGTPQSLRDALSAFYNNQLSSDQFIIGNGGSEIIDLLIRGFMDEDSECIVSNPCFMPYIMFSQWSGAKIIDVPLLEPDYSLNLEGILSSINTKTRIIFLTSPNNPSGTYIPRSLMDSLIDQVPNDILIVYDEVYYHFADAIDFTTALPYVLKGKNVVGLNSFSKTYGMAGLRLGYAYTTKEIANYISKLCKPFYINSLNIAAGIAALEDQQFVKQSVSIVLKEKQDIYKACDELNITYWPTQANFILMKAPNSESEMVKHLEEQGIMVRSGSGFGAPGCIRVTIGDHEANQAFIHALRNMDS